MKRMLILPLMIAFLLLVALLAAPLAYVAAHDDEEREGEAELEDPGNNAGSPTGVTAEIEFEDDGTTITITGEAEGLTPGVPYASLIYDIGSFAQGPIACEPTIFDPADPNNIFATMFVGIWDVDEDGEGTLSATNIIPTFAPGPPVYVPLSKIGTISIRDGTVMGPFGPGTGPAAVVACGVVEVEEFEEEEAELEDPGNFVPSPSGVTAEIRFVDDGTTLRITGIARGLTPGVPYASLIYDVGSEEDGPDACEPTIFDPSDEEFILPTMFIGFWIVAPDGTGILSAINVFNELDPTGPRVRVALDLIGTVSIRDLTVPNPGPPFFDGSGPAAVVACGEL